MSKQLRNFVFTCNNWDQSSIDMIEQLPVLFKCSYYIYGEENGEAKNTPHLQGYAELESRIVFSKIQKHLRGFHLANRMGSQSQAIEYCKKEGTYIEYGVPKLQGNRTDITDIKSHLKLNCSVASLLENDSVSLTSHTLAMAERLIKYYDTPRDYKPKVTWLYGPPGCGKTYIATTELPDAYFKPAGTGKWWSNYDGQEDVIIDDVRIDDIGFTTLLGLLDRYPCCVEDKGSIRQFKGRNIYITSPLHPAKQYLHPTPKRVEEVMEQLTRRITTIRNIEDEVVDIPDEVVNKSPEE